MVRQENKEFSGTTSGTFAVVVVAVEWIVAVAVSFAVAVAPNLGIWDWPVDARVLRLGRRCYYYCL